MRVIDLLERDALLYRDRTAVAVVDGPQLSYGELRNRVRRFASGLAELGIGSGDRVALMAKNGLTFFDVYLATAYLGATAVPLNTHLTASEVGFILADADPTLAFGQYEYLPVLAEHLPPDRVLAVDSAAYSQLLDAPDCVKDEAATEDDIALIIYTSGTTGQPKGVCLSQRALTFNAVTLALVPEFTTHEVFLTTTPLYHAATGTRVTSMLVDGQTHVVMREFDTERCIQAIDDYGITTTVLVPVQLRRVLDSPALAGADLGTLRLLVYGAAPTAGRLIKRAQEELDCGLYQGYGLSEAVTNLTGLLPRDHIRALREEPDLLTSCGRAVPGVRIEIRDEEGHRVPTGEVGEICVRTEKTMSGYWRNPEATREAITQGWLHTGDLARADDRGYLYIVGRAKDMLISGGVNVYPNEIESVLHRHPDIAEAAVVGWPDDEWGEVPVAFVRLVPGAQLDEQALREHCTRSLAKLKVPTRFEVVDDYPRTATGKIRKIELRRTV